MNTVIFACVHNAGRSQMAAAWFRFFADAKLATAISAGTQPGDRVHPEVIVAMNEVGIDLSQRVPQLLTTELLAGASLLVTMGCGEACPNAPRELQRVDWRLPDPKGQSLEQVRAIRDTIKTKVHDLVYRNRWGG